jgi:hypothetical protein
VGVVRERKFAVNTLAALKTGPLHGYLRWRNANARHPDVLAAQRRERARVRSERHHTWGQRVTHAA